jgi:hypothetical protein
MVISGVVLGRHGLPVRGATVHVYARGGTAGGPRRTRTDALGRYRFELNVVTDYEVAMDGYCAYGQRGCADVATAGGTDSHKGVTLERSLNWRDAAMNCHGRCTYPPVRDRPPTG